MGQLWCITAFFNPVGYRAMTNNYFTFRERLQRQGVKLLTVELAFDNDSYYLPESEDTFRLRSNSVMWQKERLLNYAVKNLPPECDRFAWLDCDILFPEDNWAEMLDKKLDKADIVQCFKKVFMLPPGVRDVIPAKYPCVQSITWQKQIHKNWLERRRKKELHFSHPGFGWAAKRWVFEDIGIYDRNIVGSGDTFLVDCYYDSWDIHAYAEKFTPAMKIDMMEWCEQFRKKSVKYDYLPIDIYHLWHGSLKNRGYMSRHDLVIQNNYDPKVDIKLVGDVFEWASDKPALHEGIKGYFYSRMEDQE